MANFLKDNKKKFYKYFGQKRKHTIRNKRNEKLELLTNLSLFKLAGPDEIHPSVLKKLAEEISDFLTIIFSN